MEIQCRKPDTALELSVIGDCKRSNSGEFTDPMEPSSQ